MENKKYKVEYLDWEDHEGNFGTNFVVILKAGDREEAKEELDKLLSENVDGDGRQTK
jgi:hypothetical protein